MHALSFSGSLRLSSLHHPPSISFWLWKLFVCIAGLSVFLSSRLMPFRLPILRSEIPPPSWLDRNLFFLVKQLYLHTVFQGLFRAHSGFLCLASPNLNSPFWLEELPPPWPALPSLLDLCTSSSLSQNLSLPHSAETPVSFRQVSGRCPSHMPMLCASFPFCDTPAASLSWTPWGVTLLFAVTGPASPALCGTQ